MPSQAVIERDDSALALIESTVKKEKRRLTALLPATIPAARAIEAAVAAARKTPALLECTPESFAWALREAARWGLIPDGIMGQGYLIPRVNGKTGLKEATFQAGYRGLEDLARRSGVVGSIVSGWNCVNDPVFRIAMGTNGGVEHEPALTDRGDIVGFYAAAWLTNGAPPVVVYMTNGEVIAIRDNVPFWQKTPWRPHYAQMGRKTAVRRLVQQLPLSADMQAVIGMDDEPWESARNVTPAGQNGEAPAVTRKAERMRAMLEDRRGEAEAPAVSEGRAEADGSGEAVAHEAATAGAEAPDVVTGTVRLVDRPGLDGKPTDTPAGTVIGFRLDVTDDEWVQVVLSGDVLDRYGLADTVHVATGMMVTVTGRKVIVPRVMPDGATPMPPVIRIIATEDVAHAEDADAG